MPTKEPPTVVLIHGGGHGHPAYFQFLQEWLTHDGIPSVSSTAPSDNAMMHLPSSPSSPGRAMYDDAAHWRAIILNLINAGKDVVLLMHSVGGIVGCEAAQHLSQRERQAQGLQGGVVHLIFLAAYMAERGESAFDLHGKYGLDVTVDMLDNGTSTLIPHAPRFYNDMLPSAITFWTSHLSHIPTEWFAHPVTHATWKDVSWTWIYTEKDDIMKLHAQEGQVREAKAALALLPGTTYRVAVSEYRLPAGHSPFLSMPARVAEAVGGVLRERGLM